MLVTRDMQGEFRVDGEGLEVEEEEKAFVLCLERVVAFSKESIHSCLRKEC